MKLALTAAALAGSLLLTGCGTVPAPTVTVTATETEAASGGSSSGNVGTTIQDEFKFYLEYLGAPTWAVNDPEIIQSLVEIGRTTCDFIDMGYSADEITATIVMAAPADVTQEALELSAMAVVIATYTICPEYEGFFE